MSFLSDSLHRNLFLYKPLRGSTRITWPSLPDGYSLTLLSSNPEGYIGNDGAVLRHPGAGQPDINVEVRARVTETATGRAEDVTMTVPLSAVYGGPVVNAAPADIAAAKAEYLKKKLGFFVHYVPRFTQDRSGAVVEDVDELANRFDAPQFARDMRDFGVDYVIFTTWHAGAFTLYPSAVNKRWRDDRRTSPEAKTYADRDLIADLAAELSRCGIDLHLYCHPTDGPDFAPEDQKLTGWNDWDGIAHGDHSRWNEYQNELHDEVCRRYAGKIKGLWLDTPCCRGVINTVLQAGVMNPVIDHRRFRETILAYDPGLILVVNIGSLSHANTSEVFSKNLLDGFISADYAAWELLADITSKPGFTNINPEASNSDAATWPVTRDQLAMIISPGPGWWIAKKDTGAPMTHSREDFFRYIVLESSISVSGGTAFAAGCYPDHGNLWESTLKEDLTYMNKTYLAPIAKSIKGTVPGKAYVTREKSWLRKMAWGVSTESPDGSIIYLHIMKPPEGSRTLHIGLPADGSELGSGATVLNYDGSTGMAELTKTDAGYDITLPMGTNWHTLDTVVEVRRSGKARKGE
jgi:hypothetical protein